MRLFFTLTFFILTTFCHGQTDNYSDTVKASFLWKKFGDDSLKSSYHIYDDSDTVFFKLDTLKNRLADGKILSESKHVDCIDIPTSIEKGHNWCQILKDSIPFSGYLKKRIVKEDSTVMVFSGILSDGYIKNGSYIEFYYNGKVKQSGQYENNWKVGIWTSYHQNGQIEWIGKYIEENDYPVVEFEYDKNGELEYFNDEESFMKQLIDKENEKK
jgi:hypothetical protein